MSDLVKRIDKQVQRALAFLRDGDRSPYFLRGANTFFGGQNTPIQIAFSVPADGDFFGDALNLYVEARAVTDGAPEATFRPVDWTTANDVIISTNTLTSDDIGAVGGDFELLLPEAYSNQATSIGAVFSARHGYATLGAKQSFSPYPGKLEFMTPCFIPRGTTATLVFTPTYSRAPTAPLEGTLETEYRVSALIEGYKKVKSLVEVTL